MRRRDVLALGAAALIAGAGAARADSFADSVVAQLRRQGFSSIAVGTTWLGRARIVARRKDGVREVILNPRTGEVLRDTWTAAAGQTGGVTILDDVGGSEDSDGNSGKGSDDSGSDDGSDGGGSDDGGSDGGSDDGGSGGGSDGGHSGKGGGDD